MLRIREKGVAIMSQDNGKGLAIASMVLGIVVFKKNQDKFVLYM